MDKKLLARRKVRAAIVTGRLVRPTMCERCGVMPPDAKDGRSQIHAHHDDYDRPLDVEWICARCHREETPLPDVIGAPCFGDNNGMRRKPWTKRGEKNGFNKLTLENVIEIKRRELKPMEYAKKFNVSHQAIYHVLAGETWGWVEVSAAEKEAGK